MPEFKKPPVVEVALSVQFEKLSGMRTHHIGLLWSMYRDRYPIVEEKPLLEPVFETFHDGHGPQPGMTLRIMESPEFPRCWFLNENQTRLIQVQSDRFVYNWRQVEGDEEYPRYEDIRESFLTEFNIFTNFIHDENLGEIIPNQCDVTYVNTIPTDEDICNHSMIDDVLKIVSFDYGKDVSIFNLKREDARMLVRYIIDGPSGDPVGRLHISMEPLFRAKDGHPIFILKLTARGIPNPPNIEGVSEFLNMGREHIVNGFTAWTTERMHEKWGRAK